MDWVLELSELVRLLEERMCEMNIGSAEYADSEHRLDRLRLLLDQYRKM